MVLHKILRGATAGLYLPFALAKLRAFERMNPEGFFTQKFIIGDYSIEVQQAPPSQYVRITETGGNGYFEFFTSGNPVKTLEVTIGGFTAKTYKTAVVGVSFNAAGRVSAEIRGGKRHDNTSAGSIVGRPQQVNLADEPVSEPGARTGFASYAFEQFSSFAPGQTHTGLHFRGYNFGGGSNAGMIAMRGNMLTHLARDVGNDVPFQISVNRKPIVQAQLTNDPADWPREGAVQTVTHETWGTRAFGLMIDAQNMIHVFPLSEIGPTNGLIQNVPPIAIAQTKVTLPAWCYQQTMRFKDWYEANPGAEQYGLVDFPDPDWRFSPDGRTVIGIFYQRAAANFDAAYYGVQQGSKPLDLATFNEFRDETTGYAARQTTTYDTGYKDQRYISAPGLVEVLIDITLTGSNAREFTVALELVERRNPLTTPYCTLAAGYSFVDIRAADYSAENQHYLVRKGDPVVLDIERWWRPSDGNRYSFFSLKNMQNGPRFGEIKAYDCHALVAHDLHTLSFAFYLAYGEDKDTKLDSRPGDPGGAHSITIPFHVTHPAINIIIGTRQQRLLFPDTMPPLVRDALNEVRELDPRKELADNPGFELMPLNDVRDWSSGELKNLRDYYAESVFQYKAGTGYHTPPAELLRWWATPMNAYLPPTPLLYIDKPNFGWYVYGDEILNRLHHMPYSTFFVHPGGTWAFFDQQFIYNQQGIYGPHNFDGLSIFDVTLLEHCIFDHVHFAPPNGTGSAIDTSFIGLYNMAVAAGVKAGNLTDDFVPLSKTDLKAQFVYGEYTATDTGVKWLDLQVHWPGDPMLTCYYPETGYPGGAYNAGVYPGTGGLMDLTLGAAFYAGAGYGQPIFPPLFTHYPVKFATCLLLQ